jgi:diaminohydroxyphosphoribosylaminopyrimidine deaminase/5-amino-6-(5-phosphoribosylamino)uracil reductase
MHKEFMKAALEQAYLGRGICAPNPSVGAVAVHNHKIIAKGWHQGAGTAHAERHVLDLLPLNLSNVTLYVTLEPCNHWGKTPPCVTAIMDAGISRVVYGFSDPNPVVATNDTPKILTEQGIEVIHFPLPEINEFYQSYQFWMSTKRPWVAAKIAQSLDGKIAGIDGLPLPLSNLGCAEFTHLQRLHTDIILTTARTIINDNPSLNARCDGTITPKYVAILDAHLSMSADAKIFTTAKHCHVYYNDQLKVTAPYKNCSYHPIKSKEGQLNLPSIINHLGALGFHDVWVEAGGRVFSSLHQQGLTQRTYIYIVPNLLGVNATPAYYGPNFFSKPYTITWKAETDNMIACINWQEDVCLQG